MHRTFALILFALALPVAQPALAQMDNERIPTMTLQGVGEAIAAPDMAIVTSGVVTQAETAREALTANNEAVAALMQVLQDAGIDGRDIQTSNFSVQPLYGNNSSSSSELRPRGPDIVGYQVSNSVLVRVRDLATLGPVLDQAVTVGANSIDGVNFTVSDPAPLYDEARRAAIADALAKAGIYSEAANVELVRILEINETDYGRPMQENMAMMRVASDGAVPMSGGELTFESRVNLVWEIGQ